jgi:hypothetical protein
VGFHTWFRSAKNDLFKIATALFRGKPKYSRKAEIILTLIRGAGKNTSNLIERIENTRDFAMRRGSEIPGPERCLIAFGESNCDVFGYENIIGASRLDFSQGIDVVNRPEDFRTGN